MRKILSACAVAALLGCVSAPASADNIAFIAKAGSFTVSDDRQTIAGAPLAVDDGASGVIGLELEWRQTGGMAFGLEVVRYENDVTAVGTNIKSKMETVGILLNAKKYFRPKETVNPYIGAGIGAASIDFSGQAITGSAGGLAAQAMAGVEFRGDKVGFYTELKSLHAEAEDERNQKAKSSGTGIFAGISVTF